MLIYPFQVSRFLLLIQSISQSKESCKKEMEYRGGAMDEDEISIVEANEMKNEVKIGNALSNNLIVDTPYLPEEVWFRIFLNLASERHQLLKAITVCKWWKRLLSDNGIWLPIFKDKFLNYQEDSLKPLTQVCTLNSLHLYSL